MSSLVLLFLLIFWLHVSIDAAAPSKYVYHSQELNQTAADEYYATYYGTHFASIHTNGQMALQPIIEIGRRISQRTTTSIAPEFEWIPIETGTMSVAPTLLRAYAANLSLFQSQFDFFRSQLHRLSV